MMPTYCVGLSGGAVGEESSLPSKEGARKGEEVEERSSGGGRVGGHTGL